MRFIDWTVARPDGKLNEIKGKYWELLSAPNKEGG